MKNQVVWQLADQKPCIGHIASEHRQSRCSIEMSAGRSTDSESVPRNDPTDTETHRKWGPLKWHLDQESQREIIKDGGFKKRPEQTWRVVQTANCFPRASAMGKCKKSKVGSCGINICPSSPHFPQPRGQNVTFESTKKLYGFGQACKVSLQFS